MHGVDLQIQEKVAQFVLTPWDLSQVYNSLKKWNVIRSSLDFDQISFKGNQETPTKLADNIELLDDDLTLFAPFDLRQR